MLIPGDSIPDQMAISLKGQGRISKSFMMMLEMIAQSNFSRPFYMSTTVGASQFGSLWKHFIQEGMAWRISPFSFEENSQSYGIVSSVADTEKMYDNMMNKYHYGNLKQPDLYIDETIMRMCYTHRRWFATLINHLIKEGNYDKALKALEKCETEIPSYNVPHTMDSSSLELAKGFIACGKPEKALPILEQLEKRATEYAAWYLTLDAAHFAASYRDCYRSLYGAFNIQDVYENVSQLDSVPAQKENTSMKALYGKKANALNEKVRKLFTEFQEKCDRNNIQL